ncbi:hypothetical protein PR048_000371 [Dryococelus australis]|uniref:Uncharacterized protein n=1 Tax=Dryococelus australis TaxID=614101 RepID=A0ABQ9IEF9_9NEOP|nr:hypothetical protein PR048_000371 [Dryococelus australis]
MLARLHSPVYARASDVCSLAAAPESSQCYYTPGTPLFQRKSAVGSESSRACLTNCDPIAKLLETNLADGSPANMGYSITCNIQQVPRSGPLPQLRAANEFKVTSPTFCLRILTALAFLETFFPAFEAEKRWTDKDETATNTGYSLGQQPMNKHLRVHRTVESSQQLDSPLVDDRPKTNAVKYRVVSGVIWTNRTMVSCNTDTNRTGVLAVVDIACDTGMPNPDFCTWESCRTMPLASGFLGDLPFPPHFHFGAAPYSPQSISSALKTSLLRAAIYHQVTGYLRGFASHYDELKITHMTDDLAMHKELMELSNKYQYNTDNSMEKLVDGRLTTSHHFSRPSGCRCNRKQSKAVEELRGPHSKPKAERTEEKTNRKRKRKLTHSHITQKDRRCGVRGPDKDGELAGGQGHLRESASCFPQSAAWLLAGCQPQLQVVGEVFFETDKIDAKHVYTEVKFAIGSQFIRHALDDSEPIVYLQGNNSECQTAKQARLQTLMIFYCLCHWVTVSSETPGNVLNQQESTNDRLAQSCPTKSEKNLGSPLVDDRPIMNTVKYRVVSGVVWTNMTTVSSNTATNRSGGSCRSGYRLVAGGQAPRTRGIGKRSVRVHVQKAKNRGEEVMQKRRASRQRGIKSAMVANGAMTSLLKLRRGTGKNRHKTGFTIARRVRPSSAVRHPPVRHAFVRLPAERFTTKLQAAAACAAGRLDGFGSSWTSSAIFGSTQGVFDSLQLGFVKHIRRCSAVTSTTSQLRLWLYDQRPQMSCIYRHRCLSWYHRRHLQLHRCNLLDHYIIINVASPIKPSYSTTMHENTRIMAVQ